MFRFKNRKRKAEDTEPDTLPDTLPDTDGDSSEYRRGDFIETDEKRVVQLLKEDEQSRTVYDGIEESIHRLKKLTRKIKKKKRVNCAEMEA